MSPVSLTLALCRGVVISALRVYAAVLCTFYMIVQHKVGKKNHDWTHNTHQKYDKKWLQNLIWNRLLYVNWLEIMQSGSPSLLSHCLTNLFIWPSIAHHCERWTAKWKVDVHFILWKKNCRISSIMSQFVLLSIQRGNGSSSEEHECAQ